MDFKYVIKLNGNYYAGRNKKYADMHNISGWGAIGAKKMKYEEAENVKALYEKLGYVVEIEEYNAQRYLEKCLEDIIRYDEKNRNGEDCGYAIRNSAQKAIEYLKQIAEGNNT